MQLQWFHRAEPYDVVNSCEDPLFTHRVSGIPERESMIMITVHVHCKVVMSEHRSWRRVQSDIVS